MKKTIGLIGAGGLIGTALMNHFESKYLVRSIKSNLLYSKPTELMSVLEGLDVIINLAGYPIAGRWNKRIKKKIYDSRVKTTKNIVHAINLLEIKPTHYINASAIGIYDDGIICDEISKHISDNFLSRLVKDWEQEVLQIKNVNYTVIRLGVVLSRKGGAYSMLRRIFKLGIGGPLGSGNQGFSFILIDDLIRVFDFIIENDIYGIVNGVSPTPSTNREFSLKLAKRLRRPVFFRVPSVMLKLILGEGAITVLKGQKVIPKILLDKQFTFDGNNLNDCLTILEK